MSKVGQRRPRLNPADVFYDRLVKNQGCWEWIGDKESKGYGRIGYNNKQHKAHRVSWMLHNGPIPKDLCVLHKCDNPSCVNPNHLFLGTYQDNNKDRAEKSRSADQRGDKSHVSKLTWKKVKMIRYLYSTGLFRHKDLAWQFDVGQTTIWHVLNNSTWVGVKH